MITLREKLTILRIVPKEEARKKYVGEGRARSSERHDDEEEEKRKACVRMKSQKDEMKRGCVGNYYLLESSYFLVYKNCLT